MDTNQIQVIDWASDFEKERATPHSEPGQTDALALPISAQDEPAAKTNSLPSSILSSWGQIADAKISIRMYDDLVRLGFRPDGWRGPGSKALDVSSLNSFLRFWSEVSNGAVEPELALAPDGAIHAEWIKSPQKRLDIRFSGEKLIFGLLNSSSIIEGADDVDVVTNILRSHYAQPLLWSAK
jgi:hypothetical protein